MKEYILKVNYQETMSYFDSHKLPELVRCKDCKHWNPKKYACDNINSYMQGRTCFHIGIVPMEKGKKVQRVSDDLQFTGIEWKLGDKPRLNTWYRTRDYEDMYCIRPDYKLKGKQLYKIVVYFHGDCICCGKSLYQLQSLIKEMCWGAVMCSIKPDKEE